MTPLQMAHECTQAAAQGCGAVLVVPKGFMPRGFPRGELLNEQWRDGMIERTYRFDPERVLSWLLRHGLVEIERTGERALSFREPNK